MLMEGWKLQSVGFLSSCGILSSICPSGIHYQTLNEHPIEHVCILFIHPAYPDFFVGRLLSQLKIGVDRNINAILKTFIQRLCSKY